MNKDLAVVIQARLGSTRLPGKVLADLAGQSQLERVVERCRCSKMVGRVIVATTVEYADDAVASEAERIGAELFRGDERDVLGRYVGAARRMALTELLRITADNPLIDPNAIDDLARHWQRSRHDYITIEGYPLGLGDVEAVTVEALLRADSEAPIDSPEREHVTQWIVRHPENYTIDTLHATARLRRSDLRLTVDYPADLEVARFVYSSFAPRADFDSSEIIDLLDRHPEWARRNRDMKQRETT